MGKLHLNTLEKGDIYHHLQTNHHEIILPSLDLLPSHRTQFRHFQDEIVLKVLKEFTNFS